MLLAIIVYIVGSVCDTIATKFALSKPGIVEANPVLKLDTIKVMIPLKVAALGLALGVEKFFPVFSHDINIALMGVGLGWIAVGCFNLYQATH